MKKTCLSESVQCFHFEFALADREAFSYTAGQFISAVAVDTNGKTQTRAYSIAAAPRENHFDLCVNRVEGGFFSNYLADLPEGAIVQIHGPHGNFTLRKPQTDAIFVATGTGIAPMRAFTQALFPDSGPNAGADLSEGRHIWCVYGTRHESELYYRDYFERIAAQHPNFHYIATLSRAPQEWTGHRGYVQQYVAKIVDLRVAEQPPATLPAAPPAEGEAPVANPVFDIYTYICGLNNMVSEVRDLLTERGWNKKQVVFERYD